MQSKLLLQQLLEQQIMNLSGIFCRLLAIMILMAPAFYNGYPLAYPDTGTYISSGMELQIPKDRPIMYGLFIRYFSLGFSLWLVIAVQCMMVSYTLWHVSKLMFKDLSYRHFLVLLVFLTWSTGLGWYTSQLMPDIFTAVTLFCSFLLLFKNQYSWWKKTTFIFIMIIGVTVHFANFLIAMLVLFFLLIAVKFKWIDSIDRKELQFSLPIAVIVLSIGITSMTNYAVGKTFKVSQGSHVFLIAKLLDNGTLKSFLDDKCATGDYVLCSYKDNLPESSRAFLWDGNSPLAKDGGWKKTEDAYSKVLFDLFTSPKHLLLYIYNSSFSTIVQLFQNDIGSGLTPMANPHSPPYPPIKKHFAFEEKQYSQSLQNINLWGDRINFDTVNRINYIFTILGLLLLYFLLGTKANRALIEPQTKFIGFGLLAVIFFNAMAICFLTNVYGRLQTRVSWLIVFTALLLFLSNRKLILKQFKASLANFWDIEDRKRELF